MIKRIFLDMDGVMCDCIKGMLVTHKWTDRDLPPAPRPHNCKDWWPDTKKMTKAEFWGPIDESGAAWWSNLYPELWLAELWSLCTLNTASFADIYVLSSPHSHVNCYAGKFKWIADQAPQMCKGNVILCKDKAICAQEGHVLIDDKDENVEAFRAAGGSAVLFPRLWNKNWAIHDDHRMAYVERELDMLADE